MFAKIGDQIHLKGRHQGERERDGEVIEVRGKSGQPPYVVKWADSGHTGLLYPGSDAIVEHVRQDQ